MAQKMYILCWFAVPQILALIQNYNSIMTCLYACLTEIWGRIPSSILISDFQYLI